MSDKFTYLFSVQNPKTGSVTIRVKYKSRIRYIVYNSKNLASGLLRLHSLKKAKETPSEIQRFLNNIAITLDSQDLAYLYLHLVMYNIPYRTIDGGHIEYNKPSGETYYSDSSGNKLVVKDRKTITFTNKFQMSEVLATIFFRDFLFKHKFEADTVTDIYPGRYVRILGEKATYKFLLKHEPMTFDLIERKIVGIDSSRWEDFFVNEDLSVPCEDTPALIYKTLTALNVPMGEYEDRISDRMVEIRLGGFF